jgi:hypothetical protein
MQTTPAPAGASIDIDPNTDADPNTFVDSGNTYRFDIPDGWIADSQQTLDAINNRAAELGGPGVAQYVTGFRPAGPSQEWASWLPPETIIPDDVIGPFVLIQEIPIDTAGLSRSEIAAWVQSDLAEESANIDPVFNPDTMTVTARSAQQVPPPPGIDAPALVLDAITTGYIGLDRVVYLHTYADARTSDAIAPSFDVMRDSFQFDSDAAYVETAAGPGTGTSTNPNATQSTPSTSVWVTVALAVFCVGVIAFGILRAKRSKAQDAKTSSSSQSSDS